MSKERPKPSARTVNCTLDRGLDARAVRVCPGCRDQMQLHQPDLDQPDRLLATCPSCQCWYVLDESASTGDFVRLQVPVSKAMHRPPSDSALPAFPAPDEKTSPRLDPRSRSH